MEEKMILSVLRGAEKKIVLGFCGLGFFMPVYADNITTSPADCDSETLLTDTGPATLNAQWSANTIDIRWYNDDSQITNDATAATTCTYDTAFALPTPPTKTGYVFNGWKVAQYDFSTLASLGTGNERWGKGVTSGGADYCYYKSGTGSASHVTCDSRFDDLKQHGWKVRFGTSLIYGTALCSATSGTTNTPGTPSSISGNYCWCRATNYKPGDEDKLYSPASQMPWIPYSVSSVSSCTQVCSTDCTYSLLNTASFRTALLTPLAQ